MKTTRNRPGILVPTDFSECGSRALKHAADVCARENRPLLLLHVTDTCALGSLAEGGGARDVYRQMKAAAERKLKECKNRLGHEIKVQTYLRQGRAWHEIVKFAQRAGPAMIVMGSHGYTGLKHLLLGSTAEQVVRRAPCSVLVIRDSRKAR